MTFPRLSKMLTVAIISMTVISLASTETSAGLFGLGCQTCCDPCAPPPPVAKKLCVVDPCTGCTYDVCVKIPPCCCDEEPCVTWRHGIFGRKVLTYKWKCCGHCVDIVITKFGRTIVRG